MTTTTYTIRYHGEVLQTTTPQIAEMCSRQGAIVTAETRGGA